MATDPVRPVCTTWVGRLSRVFAWLGGGLLLLLAVLMVVLVVASACFDFADEGLEELKWHLFGACFLFGMAECMAHNEHVRVDLISSRFPPRLQAAVECLTLGLIALPALALIAWYGIDFAERAWDHRIRSSNPDGLGQRWIIRSCISLGFGLLLLQVAARVVDAFLLVIGHSRPAEIDDPSTDGDRL